jgi:predicted O-methyltransferase YrrM
MLVVLVAMAAASSLVTLLATLYLGVKVRDRLRRAEVRQRQAIEKLTRRLERMNEVLGRVEGHVGEPEWPRLIKELRPWFKALKVKQEQLDAAQSLAMLGLPFPVFFRDWSIDSLLGRELVELIESRRPRTILELGSGVSSVLVAATIERLGMKETRHIVVDHLQEYLDETRRRVDNQGLGRQTEYWLCPLVLGEAEGPAWYSGIPERLREAQVDLVLVDGPPGKLHPESRRPAFAVLRPFLSADAVLLLDDTNRSSDRNTAKAWARDNPDFEFFRDKAGKGFARFQRMGGIQNADRDE